MNELWLINGLLTLLLAGTSYAIKNLYGRLHSMDEAMSTLHLIYAKREDVTAAVETIRQMVQRIEDKLDKKVDR